MKTTTSIIVAAIVVLIIACAQPEPVVRQVEVTREVTREIPVTVVVTPTPSPIKAVPPGSPALPSTGPPSGPLTEITLEYLQVYFRNYGDRLRAYADPHFIWNAPDVEVFFDLDLVVDDQERCATTRVHWGPGEPELICDLDFRSHTTVERVSVQTPQGNLQCERTGSDRSGTYFTCTRSSGETALANIPILFVNERDHLSVYAVPHFLWDAPDLDVSVDLVLVVDDRERCDAARLHWGLEEPEVVCDLPSRSHTTVQRLSVQTPQGDLHCVRSREADPERTYFFCRPE